MLAGLLNKSSVSVPLKSCKHRLLVLNKVTLRELNIQMYCPEL